MRSALTRLLCVLPVLALLACAQPPQAGAPPSAGADTYLTREDGCALVVGGSVGSSFAEPQVARFWHTVNEEITQGIHQQLVAERYRVVRLTVDEASASRIGALVVEALVRNRCNRVIQVSSDVNEDRQGRYFAFDIEQLRFVPKAREPGGTTTVTTREYSRKYRFPRTSAAFDSFHTGSFALTAFSDLKASGSLAALRQAP